MKSPDAEARELARIILDAAQQEADQGRGMVVPVEVLRQLRTVPPSMSGPMTLDEARRRLGIPLVIFEQELRHFLFVREIIAGTRKTHRRSS